MPRVHGARESCLGRGAPGFREPPVSIEEQGACDVRHPVGQEGEDEQLVPEDVPSIGFAVEAARGYAGVQIDGVVADRLEQVEDVEVQGHPPVGVIGPELEIRSTPEMTPRQGMGLQKRLEAGRLYDPLHRVRSGRGNREIPGSAQGDHLLRDHHLPFAKVHPHIVADTGP